ncbi:MAG: AAA family ATPase, partial [Nanoarchaeota archaeon]|nr:AAA family ATPase [Nanoarchaeota archaeon]
MSKKFKIKVTKEFQNYFKQIENSDSNFFLTGRAGTGKSTFIQYFRDNTEKECVVLAPTGLAAINVGGQTIHSFFKFPPRMITEDVIKDK